MVGCYYRVTFPSVFRRFKHQNNYLTISFGVLYSMFRPEYFLPCLDLNIVLPEMNLYIYAADNMNRTVYCSIAAQMEHSFSFLEFYIKVSLP